MFDRRGLIPWEAEALLRFPIPADGYRDSAMGVTDDDDRRRFCEGAHWAIAYVIDSLRGPPASVRAEATEALKALKYDLEVYHEETGRLEEVVSKETWDQVCGALETK